MTEEFIQDHDENEEGHEHDKTCFAHDDHWQDDYAYTSEARLPVPEDAPRTAEMAKLISELEDVPIFRFAVVYVNAETGRVQLATNPGMATMAAANLLAKAIGILSYQEAYQERMAQQMLHRGLGKAISKAMMGEGEMPDLSVILGGIPAEKEDEEIVDTIRNMREGYL